MSRPAQKLTYGHRAWFDVQASTEALPFWVDNHFSCLAPASGEPGKQIMKDVFRTPVRIVHPNSTEWSLTLKKVFHKKIGSREPSSFNATELEDLFKETIEDVLLTKENPTTPKGNSTRFERFAKEFKILMQLQLSLEQEIFPTDPAQKIALQTALKTKIEASAQAMAFDSNGQSQIYLDLLLENTGLDSEGKQRAREFLKTYMHQGGLILNHTPVPLQGLGYVLSDLEGTVNITPTEKGLRIEHVIIIKKVSTAGDPIHNILDWASEEKTGDPDVHALRIVLPYELDFSGPRPEIVVEALKKGLTSSPATDRSAPIAFNALMKHLNCDTLTILSDDNLFPKDHPLFNKRAGLLKLYQHIEHIQNNPDANAHEIRQAAILSLYLFSYLEANGNLSLSGPNSFFSKLESQGWDLLTLKSNPPVLHGKTGLDLLAGFVGLAPSALEQHWKNSKSWADAPRQERGALPFPELRKLKIGDEKVFEKILKFIDKNLDNPSDLSVQQSAVLILLLEHCQKDQGQFNAEIFFQEVQEKGYDLYPLMQWAEQMAKPATGVFSYLPTVKGVYNASKSIYSHLPDSAKKTIDYSAETLGKAAAASGLVPTPILATNLAFLKPLVGENLGVQWQKFVKEHPPEARQLEEKEDRPVLLPLSPVSNLNKGLPSSGSSGNNLGEIHSSSSTHMSISHNTSGTSLVDEKSPTQSTTSPKTRPKN